MKKYQENKFRMFQNVKGVLDENAEVFQDYTVMVRTVAGFTTKFGEMLKITTQARTDTTGITSAKNGAKETMAVIASEIAGSLKALAFDKKDVRLKAEIDYTYTDVRYATDIGALQIANIILSKVNQHQNELEDYMITAEDRSEFREAIQTFERLSETKGQVKSTRVSDRKRLNQLFRDIDDLLKKSLDQLILRFKRREPVFYETYKNARNILDY